MSAGFWSALFNFIGKLLAGWLSSKQSENLGREKERADQAAAAQEKKATVEKKAAIEPEESAVLDRLDKGTF